MQTELLVPVLNYRRSLLITLCGAEIVEHECVTKLNEMEVSGIAVVRRVRHFRRDKF